MRLRTKPRKPACRVTVAVVVGLFVGSLAGTATSQAAPEISPKAAATVAQRVDSPGVYRDLVTGAMVVTVTGAKQAEVVREAGAVAKLVEHSAADLDRVTDALNAEARIPGASWAVSPENNRVEVLYDSSVHGKQLAQLKAAAQGFGDAVSVTRTHGTLSRLISGGHPIYGESGIRCTLGFNVRIDSADHFFTAGHCTERSYRWYADPALSRYLGYRVHSYFPGHDHGLVRYDSSISRSGNVYLYNGSYRDITGAGNAYVNQHIYRSGSTTGLHGGYVTATNATVNYPQGTVYGLVRTNVCAEGGDSGGPMFAGNTALGMTSGGSGNCTWGGTTYFEPITRALSYYGASLY